MNKTTLFKLFLCLALTGFASEKISCGKGGVYDRKALRITFYCVNRNNPNCPACLGNSAVFDTAYVLENSSFFDRILAGLGFQSYVDKMTEGKTPCQFCDACAQKNSQPRPDIDKLLQKYSAYLPQ